MRGDRSDSHREAERVSAHLASTVPTVEAVCLFGSVSRGDEHGGSDIDLLVLGRDPEITAAALRGGLPAMLDGGRVSVAYHTPETLERHLSRWSRFGVHLKAEGEILFDRHGLLRDALEVEGDVSTYEELRLQLLRLRSFDHLERFGGRYLFALAHLYGIGRAVVFALLAERGVFEFNQAQAFTRLADLAPEHVVEIERIAKLRPFAELTTGHEQSALPFGFLDGADKQVAAARDAIRGLVGLSEHADELTDRAHVV
jgi:predicted nucleotidyltransferase